MNDKHETNIEPVLCGDGLRKALEMLDELKQSFAGVVIYKQVEHVLREADYTYNNMVRGYAKMTQRLLYTFRKQLPEDSLLYLELKLIQKRLTPPISLTELVALNSYLKSSVELLSDLTKPDEESVQEAIAPFLEKYIEVENQPISNTETLLEMQKKVLESKKSKIEKYRENSESEQRVASVFQQHLNKQHRDLLELQEKFAAKVDKATKKHNEFEQLLESSLTKLRNNQTKDVELLRQQLVNEIETLLGEENSLADMLIESRTLLELTGNNSRRLSEELDQVRVLSLTDELTNISNRRAFLRRLEDELVRAQRDKTPLTVGILDLDHFKKINDKYGHHIGDEMLRTYARDILSIFRRYDMVARYGGEEFSVILPNTDKEGAERAFKKVQKKTRETFFINAGDSILIPTFSAGLAIYQPGESMESLLERADKALYRAKQAGRDRFEIDVSTQQEQAKII